VRDDVLKALEEARNNKLMALLEAQVSIAAPSRSCVLKRNEAQLRYLFIVSSVSLTQGAATARRHFG